MAGLLRRIGFRAEAAAAAAALALARRLGPVRASSAGGALLRWIGPLLPVSRVARDNLRLAGLPPGLVPAVWDNLGRSMAELPHLPRLGPSAAGPGWELVGAEHLPRGPAILFSAHLANWEVMTHALARLCPGAAGIYRAPDNPLVDAMLGRLRGDGALPLFPKGAAGARAALRHLAQGGVLALLADQKMNDGIAVPFFGRQAMTAPALAALALRFRCPVVPAHAERLGPARFRLVVEAPLPLPASGDRAADTLALMTAVNARIEAWIRARPGEWLWLHRRWPRPG
jgi:KDO2-lipid IV(A) lauroyltransferase